MTILKVEEMSCNHCVQRIHAVLEEAKIKHSVQLDEKTVMVDGDENCVKTAMEELADIGFTASAQ